MAPTVAIVGRPNVGKSTLFNRLVGQRLALVDDRPGVTRDRREGEARLGDLAFKAIDTAGLEHAERDSLTGRMQVHTAAAIAQADAVLFLIDARAVGTVADRAFADLVRKSGKPASRQTPLRSISRGMAGIFAFTILRVCAAVRGSRRSWRSSRLPMPSTRSVLPKRSSCLSIHKHRSKSRTSGSPTWSSGKGG